MANPVPFGHPHVRPRPTEVSPYAPRKRQRTTLRGCIVRADEPTNLLRNRPTRFHFFGRFCTRAVASHWVRMMQFCRLAGEMGSSFVTYVQYLQNWCTAIRTTKVYWWSVRFRLVRRTYDAAPCTHHGACTCSTQRNQAKYPPGKYSHLLGGGGGGGITYLGVPAQLAAGGGVLGLLDVVPFFALPHAFVGAVLVGAAVVALAVVLGRRRCRLCRRGGLRERGARRRPAPTRHARTRLQSACATCAVHVRGANTRKRSAQAHVRCVYSPHA